MRRVRDNLPLLAILLLALLWRLLLWAQPLHQPANDEVEYLRVARDLLTGRGWVFYESWRWLRAPLYPLFLAGSLWVAGADPGLRTAEALHRAALPNLLLSVGLVYLIYRLALELTPDGRKGPALLAAGVAAMLQTHATFASLYMGETLFSALLTGGLLALARWRRRGGLWRALLAGALLGLACLTRSAALVFLPVAALWMVGVMMVERRRRWAWGLGGALALIVGAGAMIAPWTLRNCRAYSQCVLIETGGAYNLWAFYEPRERLDEINAALEAIVDPVERADEATRRGLARLREDPTIVLRKLPAEWTRLWVVKPIQDRFLLPSAYSDPPPALFLSALVLDDLLYLLVLCGAALGLALALARRDALGLLLGLWVAVFVGATLLTHAEGRYRHFIFMALIPLAAVAADGLLRGQRRVPRARRKRFAPASLTPGVETTDDRRLTTAAQLALPSSAVGRQSSELAADFRRAVRGPQLALAAGAALALLPLVLYYPWAWAGSGAARSVNRGAGDLLAGVGRDEAAAQAYGAALAADETPDGWIALGDLRRRAGATDEALEAYERAHELQRTYVGASAVWGDLLRELGREEEARAAFRGRYLDKERLAQWSFQMLEPAPMAEVAVGDGLDFGYVGGVYAAEEQQGALARWTDGRGRVRVGLAGAVEGPAPAEGLDRILVTLRAAAPRPDGEPVTLEVCGGGRCEAVGLGPGWRTVRVLLPASTDTLELRSPTFLAQDGRVLGVLLDWARVEAAEGPGGWRPEAGGRRHKTCATIARRIVMTPAEA